MPVVVSALTGLAEDDSAKTASKARMSNSLVFFIFLLNECRSNPEDKRVYQNHASIRLQEDFEPVL